MSFSLIRFGGRPTARAAAAALLAVLVAAAGALPAAGYSVISESGLVGPYTFAESEAAPRVRCRYGDFVADKQYLQWMRVGPPTVLAADRDSGRRDSRMVGWRFLIQRLGTDLTTWTTVARSPLQKARAYEDQAAALTAMKVHYSASDINRQFRALVVINWYRPDGSIEGRVRLTPQYYQARFPDAVGPTFSDGCRGGFEVV